MSRRDFLKSLSLVTIASALGFGGGKILSKNTNYSQSSMMNDTDLYEFDAFSGSKTSGFKFSTPLPFDYKLIDELADINKKYKKSKLTTLYGNIPESLNTLWKIAYPRGSHKNVNKIEDFTNYVKYAKSKGFNFVYLMNSPKPFSEEEFKEMQPDFEKLLSYLKDLGCYNIKIGNQQLLEIFRDKPEFNIQGATTFEYTNIRQIQNLLEIYPRIKKFNLATDTNRNIPMLKNLKKALPNVEFELLADEGSCIFGCPARIPHPSCFIYVYPCYLLQDAKNSFKYFFRSNAIYPWNIDYYAKLGYKNFKLVGYIYGSRPGTYAVTYLHDYFEAIENGIGTLTTNRLYKMLGFATNYDEEPISKEMIDQFPNINYFIKNGDKCSSICGVNCNYCYECADKFKKVTEV